MFGATGYRDLELLMGQSDTGACLRGLDWFQARQPPIGTS
jgi:hypothetical protein